MIDLENAEGNGSHTRLCALRRALLHNLVQSYWPACPSSLSYPMVEFLMADLEQRVRETEKEYIASITRPRGTHKTPRNAENNL